MKTKVLNDNNIIRQRDMVYNYCGNFLFNVIKNDCFINKKVKDVQCGRIFIFRRKVI